MRPIVNMPEDDRVTDIGNMHKNLVEIASVILEISWRTDRQTDRQRDTQTERRTDGHTRHNTSQPLPAREVKKNYSGYATCFTAGGAIREPENPLKIQVLGSPAPRGRTAPRGHN